eukprot:Pgem_evm1s3556
MFVFFQIFVNYDSGAIAASLDIIKKYFQADSNQLGLMLSLVYLGLTASSMFSGPLLTVCTPKSVLLVSLCLSIAFTIVFALAPNFEVLMAMRFFVGMTQAFMVIYGPVWVDEFAPPDSVTIWMSLIQGGVPLGVMFGYAVAGPVTKFDESVLQSMSTPPSPAEMDMLNIWRVPFFIQAGILVPLTIALFFLPGHWINARVTEAILHDGDGDGDGVGDVTNDYNESLNDTVSQKDTNYCLNSKDEIGSGFDDISSTNLLDVPEVPSSSRNDKSRRRSVAVILTTIPSDVTLVEPRIDTINQQQGFRKFLSDTWVLMKNPIFMFVMNALCGLFFVVTGIQMWVTFYMVDILHADKGMVVLLFTITSASAPIM